jgi:hypothetical protein
MGWKCVPQVMGLVRGDGMRRDGKGQAKHRANAAAIIHEAFEIADREDGHPIPIRKSASDTYDRSRTPNNRYVGYQTADDVVAALEAEAAAQTVEVQTKDKKTGGPVIRKRPLRSDAVIGVAVIFKPPCAIARTWSREQYDKFINDSLDVMATVQCGGEVDKKTGRLKRGQEPCHLFRRENIIASAEHWDEGSLAEGEDVYTGHWHKIYKPEDEAGKYRGNLIDPYFLSRLSATYPRMMRERGWDIDDCDCTDWEKFNDDKSPENKGYKAKRKSKIRQGGKSVNKYIASAEREAVAAQYEEAGAMLDQAAALKQEVEQRAEIDADSVRDQAQMEADALLADVAEDAGNAVALAQTEAEVDAAAALDMARLEADIEAAALLVKARSESEAILTAARDAAVEAGRERMQAEADRDKALAERNEAVSQKDRALKDKAQAETDANNAFVEKQRIELQNRLLNTMQASSQEQLNDLAEKRNTASVEVQKLRTEIMASRKERDALLSEVANAESDRDKAKAEAEDAKADAETAKSEAEAAKADWDAARREADALRQEAVSKAKQEAMATRDKIEAETREAWKDWLESKKEQAYATADTIIAKAKAKAAEIIAEATEAAQGEYAFLLKWLADPRQRYKDGKPFLEAAREDHMREIRKNRAMPSEGKDTERGQQTGAGRTGRTGPGE